MADTPLTDTPVTEPQNGKPPLPTTVQIDSARPPRHTPREMQMIEAFLGKNAQDITGGEGEQVMAFLTLRRLGFDPTWDQACDVFIDWVSADPPKEVPAGTPLTNLSPSVGTGE